MASRTSIWNLVFIGHRGRDELKCVAPNIDVRNRLFDFWHVAVYTFTASARGCMMRVLFEARRMRTIRGIGVVAC